MRNLFFCFLILTIPVSTALSQENKKLSKKEQKELRKKLEVEQKEAILELLQNKEWVIEAHTVYDRYNQSYQISPTINFIAVKGKEGVIQLGFDKLIGWNGVGGITLDGQVTSYKIVEGKKNNNPSVSLRFEGRGVGSAKIMITVNSSSQATAKVSGDFGDRITFSGILKSIDESSVYKGQSIF